MIAFWGAPYLLNQGLTEVGLERSVNQAYIQYLSIVVD